MTKEEAIKQLEEMSKRVGDTEMSHIEADEVLCELLCHLGYSEVVDAYNKIDKWYA